MVLHNRMHLAAYVLLVTTASAAVLRGQPTDKDLANQIAAQEAEITQMQAQVDQAEVGVALPAKKTVAQPKKPSKPAKPQTEAEKLASLSKGLESIHNLRALFKQDKPSPMQGAEKFANGAMSEELQNKDSQVWSTIESMLGAVQKVSEASKGKSKAEQEKLMSSLEGELDSKATVLSNVTNDVEKKQQQQDEEYLLGLLILHQNNWPMDKQLNATQTFMHNSPVLRDLFEHHDAKKPLAPQLAALMDKEPSNKKPKDATKKTPVAKAAASAAKAFIQLASSFRNRDCPYCAAQCVDKCHTAGKPYVTCLTDCADAGK